MFGRTGLRMTAADDGNDFEAAFLETGGNLDGDQIAAARRNDEGRVLGAEREITQDALGEA